MKINSSRKGCKAYKRSKTRNLLSTWFTIWWVEWLIMRVNSTLRTQLCLINMITALHSHLQGSFSQDLFFGMMVSITLLWQITSLILLCRFCTVGSKRLICLDGLAGSRFEDLKSARWCQTVDSFTRMFLSLTHQRLFFLFLSFCKIKISFLNIQHRK